MYARTIAASNTVKNNTIDALKNPALGTSVGYGNITLANPYLSYIPKVQAQANTAGRRAAVSSDMALNAAIMNQYYGKGQEQVDKYREASADTINKNILAQEESNLKTSQYNTKIADKNKSTIYDTGLKMALAQNANEAQKLQGFNTLIQANNLNSKNKALSNIYNQYVQAKNNKDMIEAEKAYSNYTQDETGGQFRKDYDT